MHHFFNEYFHILSDPAHLAVEITLMLLLDVLVLGLFWPLARKFINMKIHQAHHVLDKEHGVSHDEVTGSPVSENTCIPEEI